MTIIDDLSGAAGLSKIARAPEGVDALVVAQWLSKTDLPPLLVVVRDDKRLATFSHQLTFFTPQTKIALLSAWDCNPYDLISPRNDVVAGRMRTLCDLAVARISGQLHEGPRAVITTVAALIQRVPPIEMLANTRITARVGQRVLSSTTQQFLDQHGYQRVETVREPGEYAPRGGLLDIFPPGAVFPLRLDFFGDQLESIRLFDPISQRSTGHCDGCELVPAREFPFDHEAIARFRAGYRTLFGTGGGKDAFYEAVSAGQEPPGLAHWSPLFHAKMATIFDYLPHAAVALDADFPECLDARLDMIRAYWQARATGREGPSAYDDNMPRHPLPPERLYLQPSEMKEALSQRRRLAFTPYRSPANVDVVDAKGGVGADFTATTASAGPVTALKQAKTAIEQARSAGKRVILAAKDDQGRQRLRALLEEQNLTSLVFCDDWTACCDQNHNIPIIIMALERGFVRDTLMVIAEADIFGAHSPQAARRRRAEDVIAEASSLSVGDLVVHIEHGIGRYEGLETLTVGGAAHDCLNLTYHNDDKLYVPVENIELLSRYGGEGLGTLDRLGSVSWQSRKAKIKNRLRDMAGELIKVAAARAAAETEPMQPDKTGFSAFCAGFPHAETEDQDSAIRDVLNDMAATRPMDRLVCGDVGFGKTEVALRAAYVAVENGYQVVVVTPTTLLCRQHAEIFRHRFAGLSIKIGVLSRFTAPKEASEIRDGLRSGGVHIVIGTHAVLSDKISFDMLGLIIIDEEQHFGVRQKEKLKNLRDGVHVLTLSATPIPRTLQLSMAGVRDLSLIASPPVNRLAVRTFILPRDSVVIREALNREHARKGQSFYVCPRVKDLAVVEARLREIVPGLSWRVAHGGMAVRDLEQTMNDFHDGRFDILLSTSIIESGLDLPRANTLIVERSDMFGLSQLYQLRGRIGRSERRGYAYFTTPPVGGVSPQAQKRLQVLHRLDTLGAGFTLANHDLDIRGAGNLLGSEQSGHIREVGAELYQSLLEEAVADAKGETLGDDRTPQLTIGVSVMIPENYVSDLGVRLNLYRRLGRMQDSGEIAAFAAELEDRFGHLPTEVENLIKIVSLKKICRNAGITKLDAGPKGATVTFYDNQFANPAGLVDYVSRQVGRLRFKPDHSLFMRADWPDAQKRLHGAHTLIQQIAAIAAQDPAAVSGDER